MTRATSMLVLLGLVDLGCSRSASFQVSAETSSAREEEKPVSGPQPTPHEAAPSTSVGQEAPDEPRARQGEPQVKKGADAGPVRESAGQGATLPGTGGSPSEAVLPSARGTEGEEAGPPGGARRFTPLGGSETQRLACSQDSDCVVSCLRDGSCCDELCGCSQIYSKSYAAQLAGAKSSHCSAEVRCPVARCSGRKAVAARCVNARCVKR